MDQGKEKDYDMLGFILSGQVRMKIYSFLLKKPSFAYEIAQENALNISSVQRSIKELEANDVIKCLNPNRIRRKFYQLTIKAQKLEKEVLERIKCP